LLVAVVLGVSAMILTGPVIRIGKRFNRGFDEITVIIAVTGFAILLAFTPPKDAAGNSLAVQGVIQLCDSAFPGCRVSVRGALHNEAVTELTKYLSTRHPSS